MHHLNCTDPSHGASGHNEGLKTIRPKALEASHQRRLKQVPSDEHTVTTALKRKPEPWPTPCSLTFTALRSPLTGLGSLLAMQILHQAPSLAAWDLRHAAAVEDLLKQYIKTLPGGATIPPPRLFIYKGTAFSRACPRSGIDSPAYCPGDHTVYLEMGLGDQVANNYGDFGALSIIAHEFGHAYMNQRNIHPPGKEGELAADAFAGGFARYVEKRGLLEQGDVDEARATFASVGDYAIHHHDHHGTPKERRQAFEDGYIQGFRLPGNGPSAQPTPAPTAQPQQPTSRSEQPAPNPSPLPPPATGAPGVAPVIGLGLGAFLLVLLFVGVITLVNRARDDEF